MKDEDIVSTLDARDRAMGRMVLILVGAPVVLAAVFAAAFFTGHAAMLQSQGLQIAIAVLFAAAIVFAVLRVGRKHLNTAYLESMEPRILRRRIDVHQRRWRWVLLSCICSSFWSIVNLSYSLAHMHQQERPWGVLAGASVVFVIAIFWATFMAGPGWFDRDMHAILNDDFARALRGRTAKLGYAALMAAVAAAFLVTLWRPALTALTLGWVLYAGFALPALYYVIADWRASHDNEDRDG